MTTTDTAAVHPLADDPPARRSTGPPGPARRGRGFSRYPESPSPRVYGEDAAAEGQAAFEAHLGEDYPRPGRPADRRHDWVGSEVSPYGPTLRVRYPRLDVDAAMAAARAAMPAWRDAGAQVRAAVCVEIVDRDQQRGRSRSPTP